MDSAKKWQAKYEQLLSQLQSHPEYLRLTESKLAYSDEQGFLTSTEGFGIEFVHESTISFLTERTRELERELLELSIENEKLRRAMMR